MCINSTIYLRLEYWALGATLYLFTLPFLLFQQIGQLIDSINLFPISGIQIVSIVRYGLYLVALLYSVPHFRRIAAAAWAEKGILLLISLALLSTLWSEVPERTLYYTGSIFVTTYIGYYLATRFSLRQQNLILCVVLGIALSINLAAAILIPEQAVDQTKFLMGAWSGVQLFKNDLGLMAALSTAVFWTATTEEAFWYYKFLRWGGFVLSFIILIMSYSRGAIIAFLVANIVWLVFNLLKEGASAWSDWLQHHVLDFILAACLICILITSLFLRPISYLLGIVEPLKETSNNEPDIIAPSLKMSTTLTGRTLVWIQLMDKIQAKPVLGYGYHGFWVGSKTPPSGDVRFLGNNAWPNHAHNGYLEFALEFGLLGFVIFFIQFGVTLSRAFSPHSMSQNVYLHKTIPYVLVVLAVANLVDSAFMESRLNWIIYVCVATTLAIKNPAELSEFD